MNAFFEISRDHNQQVYCVSTENNACLPHFHSNIEILFVLDGKMEVTINAETRILTKGCAAVSGSYDSHAYRTIDHSKVWILIIPVDSLRIFGKIYTDGRFNSNFLDYSLYSRELESAIAHLQRYNGTTPNTTATGYMYVILGILTEHLGLHEEKLDTGPSTLIRKILIYMDLHYSESLSLDTIAQTFGYSKTYISRMFNTRLGCGFNHYLNILRARHAAGLIRTTNDNLDQIAFLSGFQSIRTFNRAFLDFYGMTPFEYRKNENYSTAADREVAKYYSLNGE